MSAAPKWNQTTAHPRVSGENQLLAVLAIRAHGSSPRERGKLVRLQPVPDH